jgi:hypothetical protein
MLQPLRDPSKLLTRYRVRVRRIADFGRIYIGPYETKTLFEGEVERPVYLFVNPGNYFEAHIITSEWAEVVTGSSKFYFINPGMLIVRVVNISSGGMFFAGEVWEIWVE